MALQDVKRLAAQLGATVVDEKVGDCHVCRIEAPHRRIWAEGDAHELVDETNCPWNPDYDDMLSRMKYGVRVCRDPDCDWCNS